MKHILLLFIILMPLVAKGQDKDVYYVGVNGISTTKGIFSNPLVGINLNKAKLQVGLLVGSSFVNNERAIGLKGEFIYLPNEERADEFNFNFIGSINYFKNSISVGNAETQTNTFQFTFGYGFDFQIIKNLTFNSNFGLGPLVEIREFNFDTNSPKYKWGSAGLISLGINYQL